MREAAAKAEAFACTVGQDSWSPTCNQVSVMSNFVAHRAGCSTGLVVLAGGCSSVCSMFLNGAVEGATQNETRERFP